MKSWADLGFEIELTGDGSPSLRLLQSVDPSKYKGESMHHSGGAYAETQIIYSKPLSKVLRLIKNPRFMVVGLGLGYIELCIAKEALLLGLTARDIDLITSYESVPELRQFFFAWLNDQELHPEVQGVYDLLLSFILKETELSSSQVKSFLKAHFQSADDIQGALHSDAVFKTTYHGILYDAFSSKTSPHLWEEDFLVRLFKEAAADSSLLTTYACRGTLKRALAVNGFNVYVREGFQGKRNSTLGSRGTLNGDGDSV